MQSPELFKNDSYIFGYSGILVAGIDLYRLLQHRARAQ
jgi:hypothetical protein